MNTNETNKKLAKKNWYLKNSFLFKKEKRKKRNDVTTLQGILHAIHTTNKLGPRYKLLTDKGPIELEVEKQFKEILKDYVWDKLIIKGQYISRNLFKVLAVNLEPEEGFEWEDFEKNFDLSYYRYLTSKGFPIESMA